MAKKLEIVCDGCGKLFRVFASRWGAKKHKVFACSWGCRWSKGFREKEDDILVRSRGFPRGFTNKEAYRRHLYENELVEKVCDICGNCFVVERGGSGRCSDLCVERGRVRGIAATKAEKYGSSGFNN